MENKYTVYKHTSPDGKVYIGITRIGTERRWQRGRGYFGNKRFYNAIIKFGWESIRHEILFTDLSKKEAEEKEIELIKAYRSIEPEFGYNIQRGGSTAGNVTQETRERMSKSRKGMHYKPRRKHTEEEKEAISRKLKGRRSPMKGKHWSVEQRARVGKEILCINTGKVYYSIREAARDTGADRANINRVLKGVHKQTRGLRFEYTNEGL